MLLLNRNKLLKSKWYTINSKIIKVHSFYHQHASLDSYILHEYTNSISKNARFIVNSCKIYI